MGFPGEFHRKEFIEALDLIKKICKDSGKGLGYHIIKPNYLELERKINEGYGFLGFSLDFYLLGEKLKQELDLLSIR